MADAFRASDADLVDLAQGGDAAAFGQLVERHQDYIYNAVWHLIGCEHDAEDIAQDVFVRAYGNLRRFEGRAKFSTWLYGIMLNSVRSYWRRRRGRPAMSLEGTDDEDDAGTDPPADDDGPEATSARREQVRLVRAAIAELDEELREIVVLRDIRGLTYDELSEALGVPSGTVKSRLHRARQALKQKLEPLYG